MNKTVLTELIEWGNEVCNDKQYENSPRLKEGIRMAIVKAQSLIPKEKYIITKAYDDGWSAGFFRDKEAVDTEHYFNQTFNQQPK